MDDKSSITNVDCPSVLKVVCGPPGHREISEHFCERNHGTYRVCLIRDETRGMDLHNDTAGSINSTALEVACPPPGIGAKI
jgi:hypothetical protein